MTADFNLSMTLIGEKSDIRKMIEVFTHYCHGGNRKAYFVQVEINGKSYHDPKDIAKLRKLTDKQIAAISVNGEVKIEAAGPYGYYCELNDVELFREMAEAVPNAKFVAEISGYQQYSDQNLNCALEGGKLSITTFYQSNDEVAEAWRDDFMKKLPLKKFKEMFEVFGEGFNTNVYAYVVQMLRSAYYGQFEYADFAEFVYIIEQYNGETRLDEDRYNEIMEKEFPALGIQDPYDFECDYVGGVTDEYVYDPVAKMYEGEEKPLFDGIGPIDFTDLIAAGLRTQGLPDDKDAISNLSIEEAYAAFAAGMGDSNA